MRTIAIIQARLGSTRLPGKVLLPFQPRHTTLSYMLERVKKARSLDEIIVATTNSDADRTLAAYLKKIEVKHFLGSETDVLDRYYEAARSQNLESEDVVVRLTGDCPLVDPRIIDRLVNIYRTGQYDFVSNSLKPYTFPDGMDVEVFSVANLEKAWREAVLPSHREHVTFYFWQNPQIFKIHYYKNPRDLSGFRLTLDYQEDYELLKQVAEHFARQKNEDFGMAEIVQFLEQHPETRKLNAHIGHNTGWQAALEADKQFLATNHEGRPA